MRRPNNADMVKQAQFKQSQLYGWDSEPVDERPSEFMGSTGYSTLSGYHGLTDARRPQRHTSRLGFKSVLAFSVVLLVAGGYVLMKLAPLLRGLHGA
jgi:hypothetical protein